MLKCLKKHLNRLNFTKYNDKWLIFIKINQNYYNPIFRILEKPNIGLCFLSH